ncbi:MAG: Dam family site-specific DNA-(adenine-N6)-methyltransferase [Thermoleophilia bacterium]
MRQLELVSDQRQLRGLERQQLLKWIGNKQRFATEIVSYLPERYGTFFEPFLGSGAILGTAAPARGLGSDVFAPLMEIWTALKQNPATVIQWYAERYEMMLGADKKAAYIAVRDRYNAQPNGADLLFLSRTCYGGVVRFRKADGYMSTPCGIHPPIKPTTFAQRVAEWVRRIGGTDFRCMDFRDALSAATAGDVVYCDPPYSDTQSILYGAQAFRFDDLIRTIAECKQRGALVALSIDGKKKSGAKILELSLPEGLFEREIWIELGPSMLRRFQLGGESGDGEHVTDRLLLTF